MSREVVKEKTLLTDNTPKRKEYLTQITTATAEITTIKTDRYAQIVTEIKSEAEQR
jgi:hypothetical protein